MLINIQNCKTTKSAWDKLEKMCHPTGPATKYSLVQQLIRSKMSGGQSICDHIDAYFSTVDKLCSACEVKIPDEVLAIILLCGLPSSFENFVIAIESRDKLPELASLKVKLLQGDRRRQSESESQNV